MTAWMIMALLGLTLTLPFFDDSDADEDVVDQPDEEDPPTDPDVDLIDTVEGTLGNDSIFAEEGQTVLGLEGDDTIAATAGDTNLRGGEGNDEISLSAASGLVNGDAGDDVIQVNGSIDADAPSTFAVDGSDGDDTITANGIGGTVEGGDGADVIDVQGRLDTVFGGAGDDVISSDTADYGGGSPIDAGAGDDTVTLTEGAGFATQSTVTGGDGDDRIISQVVVGDTGIDVVDVLAGGEGADIFEMNFLPNIGATAGAALGTIVQITDFDPTEDRLIVDLSSFDVFAQQADALNDIDFQVADRADGSGSDVTFTVDNADAAAPITGSIALDGVLGLQQSDVSLVFSDVQSPT